MVPRGSCSLCWKYRWPVFSDPTIPAGDWAAREKPSTINMSLKTVVSILRIVPPVDMCIYKIYCIFIHIHTYSYIFIHIHTYSYIFIHIHTYSYIFIHIHTYSYIFIHIHTYSYIHTWLNHFMKLTKHVDAWCILTLWGIHLRSGCGAWLLPLRCIALCL